MRTIPVFGCLGSGAFNTHVDVIKAKKGTNGFIFLKPLHCSEAGKKSRRECNINLNHALYLIKSGSGGLSREEY